MSDSKEILKLNRELFDMVKEFYLSINPRPSLQTVADEFELNPIKVRKILITAGVYSSDIADSVLELRDAGKNNQEIQMIIGLSKASVNSYLPYSKNAYKLPIKSADALRIERFRKRKIAVDRLMKALEDNDDKDKIYELLWKAVEMFEGYPFYTVKGLKFSYTVKGGEIFIDRKEKSITKASVELSFDNAIDMILDGKRITGPKQLKTFGASYTYPIFERLGLI